MSDQQPAYIRVQETILRMVEGPDYEPGDKIPSERVLSQNLQISRMTVRRAVDELVRQGVLERRSTSGTHVSIPSVTRPVGVQRAIGLSQMVEAMGGRPGSRLLYFENGTASRSVATHLQVPVGTPLIIVRRLRTVNGLPFCVESSHLPADRVPGLVAADLMGDVSLFGILQERYGIRLGNRHAQLGLAPVVSEDATLLGIQPGINVLVYRLDVFDHTGRPIEHMVSINHPQRVTFTTKPTNSLDDFAVLARP